MAYPVMREFHRPKGSSIGPGITVEWRTPDGHMLAYLDFNELNTAASVTVFDPAMSRSREYSFRPVMKARGIVQRHLKSQGYHFTV